MAAYAEAQEDKEVSDEEARDAVAAYAEAQEDKEVSDEEARDAVAAYAEAQESFKEPEKAKRAALDTLKGWMRRQGDSKATVGAPGRSPSSAPPGTP